MTRNEKLGLIKKYAPILWIHQNDAFLPEDCRVMEEIAKIRTKSSPPKPFKLDELGDKKYSKDHFMDIPEVKFSDFGVDSEYEGPELGPEGVSAHMREKFGNNKVLYPKARKSYESTPKYHGRVDKISITDLDDSESKRIRAVDKEVFGNYLVIQYYFFFVFNDSWNQHIGDWDSTLELFIREDENKAYAIFYMHNVTWMAKFNGGYKKLGTWIADWRKVGTQKRMGSCFQYETHPFVFVANGAHGGYPTPGFSLHGPKIFGYSVLGQTDCREIGKLCIFPNNDPAKKEKIIEILKEADIKTDKTEFLPWKEPTLLDDQPWLKYKGLWGTESEYEGWSGPTGPSHKSCWRMDQRRFKKAFLQAIKGDYSGKWLYNIHLNWHGWKK